MTEFSTRMEYSHLKNYKMMKFRVISFFDVEMFSDFVPMIRQYPIKVKGNVF